MHTCAKTDKDRETDRRQTNKQSDLFMQGYVFLCTPCLARQKSEATSPMSGFGAHNSDDPGEANGH